MKIGIVTHYNVHNHGALLQLYALKQILESYGHSAAAITFNKNYDFMEDGISRKYNISIKSVGVYLKYLKKHGLGRTLFNARKAVLLSEFRKSLLGEFYSRTKDLDAVFIGSDEVFSFESGITPAFFGYGIPCARVYSYAGSFGPYTYEKLEEKRLCSYANAAFSQMRKISVRDDNSKRIIHRVSGIDPVIVCDPVILYDFKQEISNPVKCPSQKYLLIYSYDNNMNESDEIAKIQNFAKENGLITVSVGFYHKWCDKNVNATPLDLFQLFRNAESVVTDTFHGSVLSLVTQSQFVVKIRGNGNKLNDLLDRYGLSDRVIADFSDLKTLFAQSIEYDAVNRVIEEHRVISTLFIKECLQEESILFCT